MHGLEPAHIDGCKHALCAGQGKVLDLRRGARPSTCGGAICCGASCFRQRQQVQCDRIVQHLGSTHTWINTAEVLHEMPVLRHRRQVQQSLRTQQPQQTQWRRLSISGMRSGLSPAPGGAPGRRRWWRSSAGTGTSGAPAHGAGCKFTINSWKTCSDHAGVLRRVCGLCSDRSSRQQDGVRDILAWPRTPAAGDLMKPNCAFHD